MGKRSAPTHTRRSGGGIRLDGVRPASIFLPRFAAILLESAPSYGPPAEAVNPSALARVAREKATDVLITESQLAERVAQLGEDLSRDYMGRVPILVGILKGSVVFLGDLIRRTTIDVEVDFIAISSYGNRTASSGHVQLLKDLDRDIFDRDVIVVEDIVDSGLSLAYIKKNLAARNPRSLCVVALLDKRTARPDGTYVDYIGFEIPDRFVVGYGLDFNERFRGLPYIGVLNADEIAAASTGPGSPACS